ncbi:aminotransferase class III-fold pyridoxal phosphate-dependent enzyme [archaeon]|nr:MAG: aminotransferase class III-fold pyridoxal phosphate-dependent enzyme [archaeon]
MRYGSVTLLVLLLRCLLNAVFVLLIHEELVKQKVDEMVAKSIPPSAFIAEPLSGNAGGVEIPTPYLSTAYEHIRSAGGLCICDEVQVGYGRLGTGFWGFEEHQIVPDIITMAKAAGNGHPFGFVIVSEDIVDDFYASQGSFFSSAGGGPISCAVGKAVLEVIKQEDLQANAREVGAYLHTKLLELQKKHPDVIGCIHGHGLYQGVELVQKGRVDAHGIPLPATKEAYAVCERLLELGVINHNTGDYSNVLKIKPPLYFSKDDADFFVQALDVALQGW